MTSFLKKLFSFKMFFRNFLKQKKFLLFLTFVFLFLLFPVSGPAWGLAVPIVGAVGVGVAAWFFNILIASPFWIIATLGEALMGIGSFFLGFVMGNPFNVPFTRPGDPPLGNPIISIGWTLTRDFVNMLFILGFAYIGLATSLGISGFDTKKAFANILIVALFVNFTPVFCGLIVDFTNIIANYFFLGLTFDEVHQSFAEHKTKLFEAFKFKNLLEEWELAVQIVFLFTYGLLAGFTFLIFAWILLFRGPIIWLLVILSPLAFFFWIFNATKKWWNSWWDQFINWSFIAIPASFFLYLSKQALVKADELVAIGGGGGGLLSDLAPYFIAIIFMAFALFLTFKMTGIGKVAIMALGTSMLGAVGGALRIGAARAKSFYDARAGKAALKPGEEGYEEWEKKHKARALAGRISRMFLGGQTEKEKKSAWGRASMFARPLLGIATGGLTYWGKPVFRKVSTGLEETQQKGIKEEIEKLKGTSLAKKEAAFLNALPGILGEKQRITAFKAMAEDDQLSDSSLSEDQIKKTLKEILNYNPGLMGDLKFINPRITTEIIREMPHLGEKARERAGVSVSDEDIGRYEERCEKAEVEFKPEDALEMKLIEKIRRKHIDSFSKETAKQLVENIYYHLFGDISNTLPEITKKFGSALVDSFNEERIKFTGTESLVKEWNKRLDDLINLYRNERELKLNLEKAGLIVNKKQRQMAKNKIKTDLFNIKGQINRIENIRNEILELTKEKYTEPTVVFFKSPTAANIGLGIAPLPEK